MAMNKSTMPDPAAALPGRDQAMHTSATHFVTGQPLRPPFPEPLQRAVFGMGCFWGAERRFWRQQGVVATAVGYAGGYTPNATYEEVCTGMTGHNEVVLVVYDPGIIAYQELLRLFWEGHDPTQGMQQGADMGTQYRSAIYAYGEEQLAQARASCSAYQERLKQAGYGLITTEIGAAPEFYYAEDYHQQYLAKNPAGYCGLGGTGVAFTPLEPVS